MKHILIVTVPDTIPEPEFLIEARCKGTFDEREEVVHIEITPEKLQEISLNVTDPAGNELIVIELEDLLTLLQ